MSSLESLKVKIEEIKTEPLWKQAMHFPATLDLAFKLLENMQNEINQLKEEKCQKVIR